MEEIQQNTSENSKLGDVLTLHVASFFLQLHGSLEYQQPPTVVENSSLASLAGAERLRAPSESHS